MKIGKYTSSLEADDTRILMFDDEEIANEHNADLYWGYTGAGPSTIGIMILDHFKKSLKFSKEVEKEISNNDLSYNAFITDVIANQDKTKDFCINTIDILKWMNTIIDIDVKIITKKYNP